MKNEEDLVSEELELVKCCIDDPTIAQFLTIKNEIFTELQLSRYAELLGKKCQSISKEQKGVNLRHLLQTHKKILKKAYLFFSDTEGKGEPLAAGSYWMVDNHPFLEQEAEDVLKLLSNKSDKELPKLTKGPFKGYPRIYWIAHELIRHTDAMLNDENLISFIQSFQKREALSMRELWAFPAMINLIIIQRMARLATFNVVTRKQQLVAHQLVDELFADSSNTTSDLVLKFSKRMQKNKALWSVGSCVFLLQKLKDQGKKGALCYQWLEEKISEKNCPCAKVVELVLHLHSTNQISITNCFASLRTLAIHDWKIWFEEVSLVHQILRKDPTNIYNTSNFKTRDRCRHEVERIAEGCKHTEWDLSEHLVDFASEQKSSHAAFNSICYFLIDDGLIAFEKQCNYPVPITTQCVRWVKKRVVGVWLFSHLITTLLFTIVPVYYMYSANGSLLGLIGIFFGFFILAAKIASQLIQWVAFYLITPKPLPQLDESFLENQDCNTLIVLHTIFRGRKSVIDVITDLEVLSIANRSPHIYFAIAADLPDALEKVRSEDHELITYAKGLIEKLNKHSNRFFLLTRERTWSSSEQMFIGWERKRGKIHQINQLILEGSQSKICAAVGEVSVLKSCKYVITLDEDTKIPPDMAKLLISASAHPFNQPVFEETTGKIVRGYSIIQPTIESSFRESLKSHFCKIFAEAQGTDPYTELISNTYQDLFQEGSYVGKAIYDVAAFEKGLNGRMPENKILSHDLLEGLFTRVGYVSSAVFIDAFPSNYITFANRLHRWIRGDWQLLPWLFSKIPNTENAMTENIISPIGRWKILDNLFRSLIYIASLVIVICAFTVFPAHPLIWFGFVFFAINFNLLLTCLNIILTPFLHFQLSIPLFYKNLQILEKDIKQALLRTVLIPSMACVTGHAIFTSLYRMFFSKTHLLQWTPTAIFEKMSPSSLLGVCIKMSPECLLSFSLFLFLALFFPINALIGAPIFILWIAAPLIVYFTNQAPYQKKITITSKETRKLEKIALETWNFFEDLATEQTHYLIPDNIQLVPQTKCAMRTSPTNIGFQLLSILSAYDLGLILLSDMIEKIENTFSTVKQMEKCHGHLYNWYNIETLKPLFPRYVSSVDSGNFVSHCIALRTALKEFNEAPIITPALWKYLHHTNFPKTFAHLLVEMDKMHARSAHDVPVVNRLCDLYEKLHFFQTLQTLFSLGAEMQKEKPSHELKALQQQLKYWIQHFKLSPIPSLSDLRNDCRQITVVFHKAEDVYKGYHDHPIAKNALKHTQILHDELKIAVAYCNSNLTKIHLLIEDITSLINATDFQFLYSKKEHLLAIGYQVDTDILDPNYYNLLASEASVTSLVAIAKGDIPYKNWFSLGRQLVKCQSGKTLLSWSGSAFEYLMPTILINPLPETLLAKSFEVIVKQQKQYGVAHKHPWGISESGYAVTDREGNYQYRAFGIPSLGLKRGLENDYVISPYSTFLSLLIDPHDALKNIEHLEKEGARGKYGFYEAIDYTRERLSNGEKSYVLKSFLAHHQGMILTSINNLLNHGILQNRFQQSTPIKAIDTLLQEPFPYHRATIFQTRAKAHPLEKADAKPILKQIQKTPHTLFPHTHVLSNGKLSQMIDNSGSGFMFFEKNQAVTRWAENAQQNDYGYYIFIKDLDTDEVWSVGFQPTRVTPEYYEVIYSPEKVEFIRHDHGIGLKMELTISPEHNVEIRQLHFKNESGRQRRLEITTYGEVVLKNLSADAAHPTFSNMFVESSFDKQFDALIFKRNARTGNEKELYMAHMLVSSVCWSPIQWESNRKHFIGKGNSIHNPKALQKNVSLTGDVGHTLDPIFSLRATIVLKNEGTEVVSLFLAVAESKEQLSEIIPIYFSPYSVARSFDLSLAKSSIELRYERVPFHKIHLYQEFTKFIFFHVDPYRPGKEARMNNSLQQESLWKYGISGDHPIILIQLKELKQLKLVKELLTAHHYLSLKNVNFDLVILNEVVEGYRTEFQDSVEDIISTFRTPQNYLLNAQTLTQEEIVLLKAVAQLVYGPQDEQLIPLIPTHIHENSSTQFIETAGFSISQNPPLEASAFFNGYGAFIDEGHAYRIFFPCPHPWSNVIGSEQFGFLITETGGGYTWSENCQSNRLTPWLPDPVSDPKSEMLYLRHSNTKKVYSILAAPSTICEHHFGYSRFKTVLESFSIEVIISGALTNKVKWWKIKIQNTTNRRQEAEVYLLIDWLLGSLVNINKSHLICGYDKQHQMLYAFNNYNQEFSGRIAFMGSSEEVHSFTTSRYAFIGRNHDLNSPLALQTDRKTASLKNEISEGTDSLGVLHLSIPLAPNEEKECVFYLAEEPSLKSAQEKALTYQRVSTWNNEWKQVQDYWNTTTSKIKIKTPDHAFNILMNGWLVYQTLSARLFAKTGYYQSSGAIGFRDQLQDTLALLPVDPDFTRKQLLLHASRQFLEGDVQHWWSPQSGKGVRTRISDDYLWLPYVLLKYLEGTNDESILKEEIGYLEADLLKEDEHDAYIQPKTSKKQGTLYEHCVVAINRALTLLGEHGLPLIGGGDWNDGMDLVGIKGKGESIWLGWFLYDILNKFQYIAEPELAKSYAKSAKTLLNNIETFGWDGEWYRRAYFDNGTPIGSEHSEECKIDSIAQSWSVIAESGNKVRQEQAIESAMKYLVNDQDSLIRLLTPPFKKTAQDPGYIKSYPPGVRENGGQYTHAAAWLILATTLLGKGNQAFDLFKMINPINHTSNKEAVEKYLGEPYVLAGDVYSDNPLSGQAGWTWYTGSAGWVYHVGLDGILGLKIKGDHFTVNPCIPSDWESFSMQYQWNHVTFDIQVENKSRVETGVSSVLVDGQEVEDKKIYFPQEKSAEERTISVKVSMR